LSNALSKETLANPLRVHPWTPIVISFSSRENSSFFLLIQRDCLRDRGSLKLSGVLNTREGLSLCGSDFVNGLLQKGVENLKWVA